MYTCLICNPIYVKGCYPIDVFHFVIVIVGGCVAFYYAFCSVGMMFLGQSLAF